MRRVATSLSPAATLSMRSRFAASETRTRSSSDAAAGAGAAHRGHAALSDDTIAPHARHAPTANGSPFPAARIARDARPVIRRAENGSRDAPVHRMAASGDYVAHSQVGLTVPSQHMVRPLSQPQTPL